MQRVRLSVVILLVTGCTNDVDGPNHATRKPPALSAEQPTPDSTPALTPEPLDAPQPVRVQPAPDSTPILTGEESKENAFHGKYDIVTIEGVLEGTWLRQQSGETLGDVSKATLLNPLRLTIGSRSLPLIGLTEELEHALLKNSGKTVRLSGYLTRWIQHGRGIQNPQAGYTGPIPANVVEFMNVSACEVIEPKGEAAEERGGTQN